MVAAAARVLLTADWSCRHGG